MVPMKSLMLAAGLVAMSAGGASAFSAVVSNDLNLRAGPGVGHSVIAVMRAGTPVEAYDCGSGWCQVEYGGQVGYASQNYLDMDQASYVRPGVTYAEPRYQAYAYAAPRYRAFTYAEPRYRSYTYNRWGRDSYAYAPYRFGGPFRHWNW
jgi:uncharacterized protein YraI